MEWWHWVLTICGSLVSFMVGGGALAIASAVIKTFFSVRADMGGIREEIVGIRGDVSVLAAQMQGSFKAGEARFAGLEDRATRQTGRVAQLEEEIKELRDKLR